MSSALFFLCSAATCACFSWSGNTEFVIVLFIICVIGFAITGLASFNNLVEIPSLPVAFLTLVLFICLCTNSSDISLNSRLGISFLFLLISMILGCFFSKKIF